MIKQRLNRFAAETEAAEAFVKLAEEIAELLVALKLRRLLREHERVFEREPARLADQLREEAREARCGSVGHQVHRISGRGRVGERGADFSPPGRALGASER